MMNDIAMPTEPIAPIGPDYTSILLNECGASLDVLKKAFHNYDFSSKDLYDAYTSMKASGKTDAEIWSYYAEADDPALKYESGIDICKMFGFYTIDSLTDEERKPPEFIVDGLIPVGLTILSGAPKIRKSFLALQLAIAVAQGKPFLRRETHQCDVVYFDLEGSKSRSSDRTKGITVPSNLYVKHDTIFNDHGTLRAIKIAHRPDSDYTLTDAIRDLHLVNASMRLFIIDTYSRARGMPKSFGANAYDSDVELLEPLQRMAQEEKIAVVCIHHEKKGANLSADVFDRASGSMGITGSGDGYLSLAIEGKRFEGKAKLEYYPRDGQSGNMSLTFDNHTLQWVVDDVPPFDIMGNPVVKFIVDHAPPPKTTGSYFSYGAIMNECYHTANEKAGEIIRASLESDDRYKLMLYTDYKIGVQLGAKSGDSRGIRVIKLS